MITPGLFWRTFKSFNRNDGTIKAGYVAFSGILALFPFLIFAITLAGVLIGAEASLQTADTLLQFLPGHVAQTLKPVLVDVLSQRDGSVLTISALAAIWTASSGVDAFRLSFEQAYAFSDPRPFWQTRLIAFGVVLIGVITFLVVGVVIVLAPVILKLADETLGVELPNALSFVRYFVGLSVLIVFFLVIHVVLPARRPKRLWPGILLSTFALLVAATGFSLYLSFTPSYTITYGTLAGVIVSLVFFYISGAVIIFGAEFNARLSLEES